MAESDPKIAPQDWFAVRKRNARAGLRKLVAIVAENRTDRAEAPLPLHKSIYMSEARNAAEMEHIFRNEPIVAGLSGDIPKTGDTLVFDSVGPSILVTRGKDGVARAFLNMCTHRGAKLVEEKEPWQGSRPRLVCPFHAWTFDPAGQGRLRELRDRRAQPDRTPLRRASRPDLRPCQSRWRANRRGGASR